MRFSLIIVACVFLPRPEIGRSQEVPPTPPASVSAPASFNPQRVTAPFRKLLVAHTEEERQALLANKSPQAQATLLEKLEEYRALSPAEREHRLRLLDLRAYITQLRNLSSADRATALQSIPAEDRDLVKERLTVWDSLTTQQKRQVWLYDITKKYLVAPPVPPSPPGLVISSQQLRMERIAEAWRQYPREQQQQIVSYFKEVFEEGPTAQQARLTPPADLTEQERQQIVLNLEKLKNLPPTEREKCLNGFTSFAALPRAGRVQFLSNVNMWRSLSPDARAALTTLTEHLPPLPPDFYAPPPPTPEFPRRSQ